MNLLDYAFHLGRKLRSLATPDVSAESFQPADKPATINDELSRLFFSHKGRPVETWVHYLPIYDRHFSVFRGTPVSSWRLVC